jgi:enoyl-CoA hydratase
MVRVEWRGQVVVITIDRPERRNAVDHATLLALVDAQRQAAEGGARVVLLTGAPPAFSAGADLTGVESGEFVDTLRAVLRGFTELPAITVAAVDGPALGAGTQLAIACDLRIATPTSSFGIPAARLGLAVDRWTVERLARELSWPVARAMLVGAVSYRAEHLHTTGGVHRLGDLAEALVWADELAALAPLTVAAHKMALERSAPAPSFDPVFEQAFAAAWASADAEEGRTAFLEKRRPEFGGR